MVATQNDSFHLPDYEERLWDELRALHEHEVERNQQGRRPGRFRRPRPAAYLGAVAALAVVVGLVAVVLVTRGDGDRTETGRDPERSTASAAPFPPPAPTGPLPDDSVDSIAVREVHVGGSRTSVLLLDEATGANRTVSLDAAGEIDAEVVWEPGTGSASAITTNVDHGARQYREVVDDDSEGDMRSATEWIQRQIEMGNFTADGTEVIDGVELLRFVQHVPDVCETDPELEEVCTATGHDGGQIVWMEPESMRPVRDQTTGGMSIYTYLPRTAENVALVEPVVPEGYERVEVLGSSIGG